MKGRAVMQAITRQVVPPRHVRTWLLSAAIPSVAEVEAIREALVLVVVVLAVVVLIFGRSQ
jgi:hypothetical protein